MPLWMVMQRSPFYLCVLKEGLGGGLDSESCSV